MAGPPLTFSLARYRQRAIAQRSTGVLQSPDMLTRYERAILQTLWHRGPLSRWELHQATGMTPNQSGETVGQLLAQDLVQESEPRRRGRGRPAVPVSIDDKSRHVLGLAIQPGQVTVNSLSLRGEPTGEPTSVVVNAPTDLVDCATQSLMAHQTSRPPLAIGLSLPGFVDPLEHAVLSSSAWRGEEPENSYLGTLEPIYKAAGDVPVVLDNDMHALTARWLLSYPEERADDLLLVHIEDGRFGASLVIGGRPNRGCVTGANEMGHTRFFVDTAQCYCGHTGCLERIVSTDYLHRLAPPEEGTLPEQAERYQSGHPESMETILDYLACGLGNALNFVRPERLVLVSSWLNHGTIQQALIDQTLKQAFPPIAERVRIECVTGPGTTSAENAGWLAIAELLEGNWSAIDEANGRALQARIPSKASASEK
jgi:predicted NBD/HSP70 family sugar kinase